MKLLFTHRYYYPDTAPYALMLRTIAQHFAAQGHDVNVFASKLSYRNTENAAETVDAGIKVRRVWVLNEAHKNPLVRIVNVFLYCVGLFLHILRTRPDVVTASTFPPVISGWVASLAARMVRAKFIYHVMDIHPEVSQISGGLLAKAPFRQLLIFLDNQTLRRSAAVVVLSIDMLDTLNHRNQGKLPIHVIENFMLQIETEGTPPDEFVKKSKTKRVIFAGNLGRFQNLDVIADGVALCFADNPDLELMWLGDGSALSALKEKWATHPQVTFAPFMPLTLAMPLIRGADLGVVSLNTDIYRVASPSKALTYLGLGLPILALVEPHSALARTVKDANLGVVADRMTPQAVADALRDFLNKGNKRQDVVRWYAENAHVDVAMKKWENLLNSLEGLGP